MNEKRANSALWKIALDDDEDPADKLTALVDHYRRLSENDPIKHPNLGQIDLTQPFEDVELTLYLRVRRGFGLHAFVGSYLTNESDRNKFRSRSVDGCLFIKTLDSLFAVTSGDGYRVIEDRADYSFPFDTAKKLIANSFKAAEIRNFTGVTTSRTEIYRRGQSIESSDSFGKVWKRLVCRLNSALLPEDSYLRHLIDPSRPPTIEIKSSFTLRKSLDLRQLVSLAQELETLPEPSDEQLHQLSFLDNLYQVRSSSLKAELKRQFIENLRQMVVSDVEFDFDVCDPDDVARYYAGSDFRLSYWRLGEEPPDRDDVVKVLRLNLGGYLRDTAFFAEKMESLHLQYATESDTDTPPVRKELYKFMHGQVDHDGQTYFLLDKIWYRIQGDFLTNLKKDFIEEVFASSRPVFIGPSELAFIAWDHKDEDAFNVDQAGQDHFYFGDKIFATSNRGKVELFDLLRVDESDGTLYVIHVKDGFDAKMRDACSQISISAEVIRQDVNSNLAVLRSYYDDWARHPINVKKSVSRETFLGWFKGLKIVYVVLASTAVDFSAASFERGVLHSHIARREVLATRNEFKLHDNTLRLAHTRRRRPKS